MVKSWDKFDETKMGIIVRHIKRYRLSTTLSILCSFPSRPTNTGDTARVFLTTFTTLVNANPNLLSQKSVRSLSRCVCTLHEDSEWSGFSPPISLACSKGTTRSNGSSDLPANKRPRYVSSTIATHRFNILSSYWQGILRWVRLCF